MTRIGGLTFDGAEVIVPNGILLSDSVTNWTLSDRRRRIDLDVGAEYGTPAQRVIDLLVGVAKAASALPVLAQGLPSQSDSAHSRPSTTFGSTKKHPASGKTCQSVNCSRSHRPGAPRAREHRRRCHQNDDARPLVAGWIAVTIPAASVWATCVLSGQSKNAEVDFTDAGYSRTQTAEVDATAIWNHIS